MNTKYECMWTLANNIPTPTVTHTAKYFETWQTNCNTSKSCVRFGGCRGNVIRDVTPRSLRAKCPKFQKNFCCSYCCTVHSEIHIVHSPTNALFIKLGKVYDFTLEFTQISLLHVSVFDHHQGACTDDG
jgi:hypothetical protein